MVERETFDIAIAGGSLAGVLTALRIRSMAPHLRIVLLEQEDHLGGRLVSMMPAGDHNPPKYFGYGLSHLSDALLRYWTQCLQMDWSTQATPSGGCLETFNRLSTFGILAGNKISEIPLGDFLSEKSAKALGGPAAVRDWIHVGPILEQGDPQELMQELMQEHMQDLAQDPDSEAPPSAAPTDTSKQARPQTIGQLWNGTRKSPAAVILEHLANLCGIPDLWSATPVALKARSQRLSDQLFSGDLAAALQTSVQWVDAFQTTARPAPEETTPHQSLVQTQNMILSAKWADLHWELRCERNTILAKSLVVAQSPWNALHWLPKGFWPSPILQIALKTKPVSLVVLSEQILDPQLSLPDFCVVPAERCQFVVTDGGHGAHGIREISFQATIDYELSMQAPAVIKAVKALKRSRKKLLALYPGALSEFNHIALQPDAWAQSPALTDLKWLQRLGTKPLATPKLAFVGDAYGPSHHGDSNILFSVSQAVSVLAEKGQP